MSDDPEPIDSSITPLISTLTFGGRIFGRAMSRITVEGAIDEIPTEGPVILASAGIGCTPTASILRSLAESGSDRQALGPGPLVAAGVGHCQRDREDAGVAILV